jgi:hypothetical protein
LYTIVDEAGADRKAEADDEDEDEDEDIFVAAGIHRCSKGCRRLIL